MPLFKKESEHLYINFDDSSYNGYFTVLFYIISRVTHKRIVVATNHEPFDDDGIRTVAFYCSSGNGATYFKPIDNDKDWEIVNFYLNAYNSRVKWFFVNLFSRRC